MGTERQGPAHCPITVLTVMTVKRFAVIIMVTVQFWCLKYVSLFPSGRPFIYHFKSAKSFLSVICKLRTGYPLFRAYNFVAINIIMSVLTTMAVKLIFTDFKAASLFGKDDSKSFTNLEMFYIFKAFACFQTNLCYYQNIHMIN